MDVTEQVAAITHNIVKVIYWVVNYCIWFYDDTDVSYNGAATTLKRRIPRIFCSIEHMFQSLW